MSLYIDQDVRANVLAVMSRVRDPRTLREISWHIPHASLLEVGYTIDVMVLRGEVKLILDPDAAKRYVLARDYYRIPDTRGGFYPDRFIRAVLLGASAVVAVLVLVLVVRALPW